LGSKKIDKGNGKLTAASLPTMLLSISGQRKKPLRPHGRETFLCNYRWKTVFWPRSK